MTYSRFIPWQGELPKLEQLDDRFKVNVDQALDDLLDECEKLGADEVLIESGFAPSMLTRQGRPPARGNPEHPGIRIAMTGPVTLANSKVIDDLRYRTVVVL